MAKKNSLTDKRAAFVLTLLVVAFVILTLTQDLLRSELKNSAFYFSESFIFSSFWWLFAPLLLTQYFAVKHKNKKRLETQAAIIILPIFIHLFAFPFLVRVLSAIFYNHTYSFHQAFRYALSEHLYLLVLMYSIPILVFQFFYKKTILETLVSETQNESYLNQYIKTILVSDGRKKQHLLVSEILYFSANPPYINIHLEDKKHLHHTTLKSISIKLNPEHFVRVHKSTIVNIEMVTSYTTRLNGDYDIIMKNNVQIRVSRNFAGDFKHLFHKTHQHTTK
ncbi:MAG: LytTR family transcriptional regulator [Haliscomenobacter sp.]|nr:LytTR family transcriptional regulator [Haliscomenobacter sp.]